MKYPIFPQNANIMQDNKATAIRETRYARRRFANYLEEQLKDTDYTQSDKTHLVVAFIYLNDVMHRLIEDDYGRYAFNDMLLLHHYFDERTQRMLKTLEDKVKGEEE